MEVKMFLKICAISLIFFAAMPTFGSSDVLTAALVNKQPVKPPPPEKKMPKSSPTMYAILNSPIYIKNEDEESGNSKNNPPKN